MSNKGFNPLFLSALDILTGALGVFIVLNFLNTRVAGTAPATAQATATQQKQVAKPGTSEKMAQSNRPYERRPGAAKPYEKSQTAPVPSVNPAPQPTPTEPAKPATPAAPPQPPAPPQDPVAVDLMKQTEGAVVILLQQPDKAKTAVEFMLRQGSRTWKPSRAGKYQDNDFQYQKSLNYFFQKEIQAGVYEVLVRVKRGQRGDGAQPFALYGKLAAPGQKSRSYHFGNYALGGSESDWVSAGSLQISDNNLSYQSRLSKAAANVQTPGPSTQPAIGSPEPKARPVKGRAGKWGK